MNMTSFLNLVDPATGLTMLETIMQALVSILSMLIFAALSFIVVKVRNLVPAALQGYFDAKLRDSLHAAANTAVKNVLLEGSDPRTEIDKILNYMKSSAKDAFANALKTRSLQEVDAIFTDIALSKVPAATIELARAGEAAAAGALEAAKAATALATNARRGLKDRP